MADSKKSKKSDDGASSVPSFEQSLEELQQIVDELEDGSLGLADSMQRFEQGIKLLRSGYGMLEEAEQKIELLTGVDDEGNPLTKPFDATSTIDKPDTSKPRRKRKKTPQRSKDDDTEADDDPAGTLF